jgi:O-antigen ligase
MSAKQRRTVVTSTIEFHAFWHASRPNRQQLTALHGCGETPVGYPQRPMVLPVRNRISELTLLLMICLAPWAYGSVEAWAELGLYAVIGLLTVLGHGPRARTRSAGLLVRLPGMALAGLALLAVFQAMPLSHGVLSWVSPSSAALRADLLPDRPEQVAHAPGPAVPLPATTLSIDPDSSVQTAARLAAAWLLFHCVLGIKDSARGLALFAKVVVFNSVLLALFAIVQALTWNGQIYWSRPVMVSSAYSVGGPFLSHNHLAAYLNLGLGLALGLLLRGNSREILRRDSPKLWTAYGAGIIAICVVTSHSRSGFLGFLAACLVLAMFLRTRLSQMGVGLVIVLVIAGLFLALLGGSSAYAARLLTILDLGDQGYQARIAVWRGAIHAWWERPVWGSGLGSFPVATTPHLTRELTVFFARAENEYIDMCVEGGAVGLFLLFAFMTGIAGLGLRALRGALGKRERAFVAGAAFGLIALTVQSCADFGSHIPAVGVTAVVLCGIVARLGRDGVTKLAAQPAGSCRPIAARQIDLIRKELSRYVARAPLWSWLAPELGWLASVLLAAALIAHGIRDAWIEDRLARAGLPLAGTLMPTVGTLETTILGLDEWRDALQDAVRQRPNWAEGYLRLGLVHLGLYRRQAKEWLEDSGVDPKEIARMAEPLWLLGALHDDQLTTAQPPTDTAVLSLEPIRDHLAPAVICFLEARRCCPFLALTHAELASLHELLIQGDPASRYGARALGLSGNDGQMIDFLAQVAVQTGDVGLAAHCWRKKLDVNPSSWPAVADEAATVLSATELLSDVAVDGRNAVRFAERLYGEAEQRQERDLFFQTALTRLATDHEITAAERLFCEAHASAGLNLHDQACERMTAALALEPGRSDWREDYVAWLLRWARPDEAHRQALIGQYFAPESEVFRAAVDRSAEALARGGRGKDEG